MNILAMTEAFGEDCYCSELIYAWRTAQEEAVDAYDAWRLSRGRTEYLVYRAAQDRADAAQDEVAEKVPILPCAEQ